MPVSYLLSVALMAAQGSLASDAVNTYSVEFMPNDNCVIDGKTAVRCDHLADRLRSVHVRTEAWINLLIDNAKYETVVATLDSLGKSGFTDVDVMPPINGTNLSSTVKRWLRLRVVGIPNHPFAMLLISTEQFKTWREELLVLSPGRYELIERFIESRVAQPDCKDFKEFRHEPPYDNVISISERHNDGGRSCVIPRAESCKFLSDLLALSDMFWTEAEMQPVRHVRGELTCEDVDVSSGRRGKSNNRLERSRVASSVSQGGSR
jgi:hypothetical protein